MAALTTLMTRFCVGEDSWLARSNSTSSKPEQSKPREDKGEPQRSKHKHRNNGDSAKDTAVNVGFSGYKPGQPKEAI